MNLKQKQEITLFLVAALAISGMTCILYAPSDLRSTLLPVLVVMIITGPILIELWHRSRGVPLQDVGVLYIAALLLYLLLPVLTYWGRGMTFTPYNDLRLYWAFPTPANIAAIEWKFVIYTLSFAIVYRLLRSQSSGVPGKELNANLNLLPACVFVLVGIEMFVKIVSWVNHISGANYQDLMKSTVQVFRSMPYIVVQIYTHCESMIVIGQAATLVFLFRDYKKYRLVIWGWLITESAIVVTGLGSRAPLVALILIAVILYDRFVSRVRPLPALLGTGLFLAGYLGFGFVRGLAAPNTRNATFLNSNNEFEALFANAFDLYRRKEMHTLIAPPMQVYFNDLLAPIPSQLLPFEKLDGAIWYTRVLGIEDTGAAYGFGVLAESAVGLGWIELVLKGALVGFILAGCQRWYSRRASKYWPTVIYVYLEICCYWLFRTSSLYYITLLAFNVLPFYIGVRVLSAKRVQTRFVSGKIPARELPGMPDAQG